jgi:hypothetical protein
MPSGPSPNVTKKTEPRGSSPLSSVGGGKTGPMGGELGGAKTVVTHGGGGDGCGGGWGKGRVNSGGGGGDDGVGTGGEEGGVGLQAGEATTDMIVGVGKGA